MIRLDFLNILCYNYYIYENKQKGEKIMFSTIVDIEDIQKIREFLNNEDY